MKRKIALIIVVAGLTLIADQATKQLARTHLRGQPQVSLVDGYLALEYHENPGMAFGIGRDWPYGRYILTAIGLVALYIVWRMVRHIKHRTGVANVSFGLVAGGAIGNLVDRVYLGRVVDFVVMHWQRKVQWPAYNVADAALVVGVLMLVIVLGRKRA